MLIVRTTDKAKHFHPFGIAMCCSENDEAFNAVKESVYEIYKVEYQPKILVDDASDAITNGFKEVFEQLSQRVMC